MPGDVGDQIEAKVDPALLDGSGDPDRKLPISAHRTETTDTPPPVYDPVAEGTEGLPTEEELRTLRRVPAPLPWKVFTIAFVELVERMSYYGTTAIFTNFISKARPQGSRTGVPSNPGSAQAQPGVLGMGKQTSFALTTFNQFFIYIVPMFGAWVADTHLGRFKTIVYSVMIAEIGHILLTCSAIPEMLDKPKKSLGLFIVGLVVMGFGTGTFKPNISPLIVEQIPQESMKVETTKKGERVIVDPVVTTSRIYNWFYMFINIGALIGQIAMVYAERYVGFYLAFLLPTICFLTPFPVLFFCNKFYTKRPPSGSVLGPAIKLPLLAMKGRWHLNPIATWKHWRDGTFWDSVKPSRLGAARPAWMTFDDAWVDEVARGWSACGVLLWLPLYWLTYNQINNNLTAQASTLALHGVPNDLMQNIDPIAIMILVPLFDLLIYPFLRKKGIKFTPIRRITTGFMLGSAAMIWATVVQTYIYRTSPCHKYATDECYSPINVWAQTGAYVLVAASEIFASVASLEYAFTKAPRNMRSLVQAFSLFTTSLSAALGEAFTPLAEDPLLEWNYGVCAVIAFVAGCLFWLTYRDVDKEEDRLNMLPAGGHLATPADPEAHMHAGPVREKMSWVKKRLRR